MARNSEAVSDNMINRIVEGTHLEGQIKGDSNIRIDGSFKGSIHTKGRLVIGTTGVVEGTVFCQNADVEGRVNGQISIEQQLTLKATARLDGEIYTDKLYIEPGALFTGKCDMGAKVKDITSFDVKEEALEEKTA